MELSEILNITINDLVETKLNERLQGLEPLPKERYFNITESADYLKMSRAKFWKLRKSGEFTVPLIVINDMQAYDRYDLDKYMEEHKI